MEQLSSISYVDPGAPFKPDVLDALSTLKKEDRAAFEVLRSRLKKAGCRVTVLDEALMEESGDGGRGPTQADILILGNTVGQPIKRIGSFLGGSDRGGHRVFIATCAFARDGIRGFDFADLVLCHSWPSPARRGPGRLVAQIRTSRLWRSGSAWDSPTMIYSVWPIWPKEQWIQGSQEIPKNPGSRWRSTFPHRTTDILRNGSFLNAYCRDNMARFKAPKTVVFGRSPKTSTGKV
jgi:hypothetical protein